MQPKPAFILSLLITLLIATNIFLFSKLNKVESESAFVSRVIDGDTLVLENGEKIRLNNINSPERGYPGFEEAKQFLLQYENATLQIEKTGTDKYGRTLAKLYASKYINLEIVKRGLATKFLVDESELKEFQEAEDFAIENSLGIWEKSSYYNCFDIQINLETSSLTLQGSCDEVNMTNWHLREEGRKEYKFPNLSIKEVNIQVGATNNNTKLSWNENVLNTKRNTLYLFDSQWKFVTHTSFGY